MRGRSDGPREGRGKSLEIFEWEGGHFRRSSSGFGQVTVLLRVSTFIQDWAFSMNPLPEEREPAG